MNEPSMAEELEIPTKTEMLNRPAPGTEEKPPT
jgi:hypothetical protein